MTTTKPQHTPGNRRAVQIKSSKTIYRDHEGNEVKIAAFVLAADNETVVGRFAKMEDALLDAAAPELLEALQWAMPFAEQYIRDGDMDMTKCMSAINVMRRAMGKEAL